MKNILTFFLFRWAFERYEVSYEDNEYLVCSGYYIFRYDGGNGYPGPLKWYLPWIDGFWNYIRCKDGKCVGADGEIVPSREVYKNCIEKANSEQIKIYNDAFEIK